MILIFIYKFTNDRSCARRHYRWKIELEVRCHVLKLKWSHPLTCFNFRWIFWILTIIGGLSVVFVSLFVPETLRSLVGNGSGYANPTPSQWLARRRGQLDEEKIAQIKIANGSRRPMNFLAPFIYLTEPDVAITLIFSGFLYCSMYTFMTSTTNQFTIHYNLNELQIGLCFLCQGFGSIVGSFVKGKLLDRDFKRLKEKTVRENPDNPDIEISFYKARLGGAYVSLFFVDVLPIAYGWAMHYNAPLPVALILQFLGKESHFFPSIWFVC